MLRTLRSGARSLLAASTLALAALSGCSDSSADSVPSVPASETYAASLGVNIPQMTKKSDALYILDNPVGTGAEAIAGRTVKVKYTGYFTDGRTFDSGEYQFVLGTGNVIQGWDLGIPGMKVGGKRKLVIGSVLGYGRDGSGPIGPNKTLVFDTELLSVQ